MATLSENDVKILLLAFECSEEPLKVSLLQYLYIKMYTDFT